MAGSSRKPVENEFRRIMAQSRELAEVRRRLEDGPCSAGNMVGSSAALLLAAWTEDLAGVTVVLVGHVGEARGVLDDMRFFHAPATLRYLPTSDESDLYGEASGSVFGRRLDIAAEMRSGGPLVIVSSVAALLDTIPAPETMASCWLELSKGQELDRDELAERLAEAGFEPLPLVERPGQFSVRGVVVDVFDHVQARPVRIEFDGDFVDSLRSFDHETQLSIHETEGIALSLLKPGEVTPDGVPDLSFAAMLPDDVRLVLRDPDKVREAALRHLELEELQGSGVDDGLVESLLGGATLELSRLPVPPDEGVDFDIGVIQARGNDMAAAVATLDALSNDGERVGVCFVTDAERQRFWTAVDEEAEPIVARGLHDRPIGSLAGSVFRGFRWRSEKCVVVNHRELFDISLERRQPIRRQKKEEQPESRAIDDFVDLAEGDYVVHVAHGIARFVGIESMEKQGEIQEFLNLEFRDALRLYVPVAKADLVQKYIGGKGEEPLLSKLGGRHWAKKKDEVLQACADLAADLLENQAIRERKEGIAYPPDTPWQHEFEASFPYEETVDQLDGIEKIKADMESPRPMDRLICGDVGYGKTELAMRAAFKAAAAGRQVALLVPTTVLAEQHARTFAARMAGFPFQVDCLSRFRSKKEQERVIVGLVEGSVDIVIGTHRLLSKDVAFKDLGLIVIDEEQRFGVAQKERLRTLRRTVDILTLTATPIPRTLHLSLLGVRDISSLTQAPAGRQSVETRVVRYDEGVIRTAVLKELERGGQCFFVHNRVQTIEKVRRELERIVPTVKILVIHGQMKEREIERNLKAFIDREAELLLATTIVESGLDIQSANTMFIDRPDMYGLAELHQLRGRVGRHKQQAYAWLLLRPDAILGTDAEKRLRAIEEFTDLGSGFRIAMRDLEIRGAGNILGQEQHGHITAVGYDMYCRLLEAAVGKLKKQRVVLPDEVDLNLDFEAYLPAEWISDARLKLEMYRRLGRAAREEDFARILDEMRDRFGPPPQKAREFVDVCRIRAMVERLRIRSVAISRGRGLMIVPERIKAIQRRLHVSGHEGRVIEGRKVLLPYKGEFETPADVLELLKAALDVDFRKPSRA